MRFSSRPPSASHVLRRRERDRRARRARRGRRGRRRAPARWRRLAASSSSSSSRDRAADGVEQLAASLRVDASPRERCPVELDALHGIPLVAKQLVDLRQQLARRRARIERAPVDRDRRRRVTARCLRFAHATREQRQLADVTARSPSACTSSDARLLRVDTGAPRARRGARATSPSGRPCATDSPEPARRELDRARTSPAGVATRWSAPPRARRAAPPRPCSSEACTSSTRRSELRRSGRRHCPPSGALGAVDRAPAPGPRRGGARRSRAASRAPRGSSSRPASMASARA